MRGAPTNWRHIIGRVARSFVWAVCTSRRCPMKPRLMRMRFFSARAKDIWPQFLRDFRQGTPQTRYQSQTRSLLGAPRARRDLIKRHLYLVPNSIVVSRGCPHLCDFCYVGAFFQGGKRFYTQAVDEALAAIEALPGRHVYFLDDHLFGHPQFAAALFEGMKGMGRLFQAAATVPSLLKPGLLELAAQAGLRSIFVGFETLDETNLRAQNKTQNLDRDYNLAIQRAHDNGVMINGSFVFGMDEDDASVFSRTVNWAVGQGIETATFHILTPYPGTDLYARMAAQNRLLHSDWKRYDTRQVVYQPAKLLPSQLENGYWRAYRDFYSWPNIVKGAQSKNAFGAKARHVAYAGGWKKFEPLWGGIIKAKRAGQMLPVLEQVLSSFGAHRNRVKKKRTASTCSAEIETNVVKEANMAA